VDMGFILKPFQDNEEVEDDDNLEEDVDDYGF
jgi:hypothetical protein